MRLLQLGLAAFIATVTSGCFYTTGPTEIGVKVHRYSIPSGKGVDPEVYASGTTHFYIPVISEFHTFDTKLQNMEMTFDPERGDVKSRDDLLFKTIDGNDISLDIIITYRIDPKKAGHILEFVAPNDQILRQKIVRAIARSRPRDIFGELKTEEFYIAQKREQKSDRSLKILNGILNPYGVIVEKVATKNYRFNEAYQQAIEDKKVADQTAEKNRAATLAAKEEWLKKLEEAQAEVNRMVADADGRLKQASIEADAYFKKQEEIAKGIEVQGINEAKGIEKMTRALSGTGGKTMVKLKIAEALKNKKILLVPSSGYNIQSTDMNQLLGLYGLTGLKNHNKPKANKKRPGNAGSTSISPSEKGRPSSAREAKPKS